MHRVLPTSTVACVSKTPLRRARASRRPVLYAVAGLALAALSVAATEAVSFLWNGSPYPSADPDTVAQRLMVRPRNHRCSGNWQVVK